MSKDLSKEQQIARSLYLNHFANIQKENEELKKLRTFVDGINTLEFCECDKCNKSICLNKIGYIFIMKRKDERFQRVGNYKMMRSCVECFEHFTYCSCDRDNYIFEIQYDFSWNK